MAEWAVRLDWNDELTEDLAEILAGRLEGVYGIPGRVADGVVAARVTVEAPDAFYAAERAREALRRALVGLPVLVRVEAEPMLAFMEREAALLDGAMVS